MGFLASVQELDVKFNRRGITRSVLLVGKYAIKVPNCTRRGYRWKNFLQGLLSNMQEVEWSAMKFDELCPVLWHLPGGWLIVMPRVQVLTDVEWFTFDYKKFCFVERDDRVVQVPIEWKRDSFGWLDGKIVGIDYGV